MLLAEFCELLIISDRLELLIEVGESLGRLFLEPLVIVEAEMMFPLSVDDMADHDERDFWDGTLASENGKIEIDHGTDSAVALPRCELKTAAECVREAELLETVSLLAVAFHRWMALLVKSTNVFTEVVFGRISLTDARRARSDQPPSARGFVTLEVGTRDGTITGSPT
ncbi:hypothetical protein C447_00280 [Halococcus hamelinensis 100A6]|uniref:Uncharacterized protein n=1 Tax=Halococcus hamelinensis 100A6 TaxID=1132509 RepID=M0MC71_9EURY|nr:hypothetical protein C447_00280 [Halococcus hamelinensis 100A6]